MKDRWQISQGLRRVLAVTAVAALVVGGAEVISDYTTPGSGFSTVQTAAAEPTGPPGPTGGMTDGGGSQFQPPQMPGQLPEYQGGNQPPLNQDNGISIYQTGAQGAPQQGGQQGGQQPQQGAQQPQHGNQPPNYQTAAPYTQGPGQSNPDYQAPQQNAPQQGSQQQQGQQQPNQQQEQQPQNKQDENTQQLNDQQQQQRQQQCESAVTDMANTVPQLISTGAGLVGSGTQMIGGGGRSPIWFVEPGLLPDPSDPSCPSCPKDSAQKDTASQQNDNQQQPKDPRDCKNGAASGKCVPDEDISKDGCYVLSRGTSCGTVCESYNLGQLGSCVARCATVSCTEYLNQKSSKALAEWSTRFAADNGGWQAAFCAGATGAAGYASKIPNAYAKMAAGIVGFIGFVCGTSGGVNSIQAGVVLEAIKNSGGCLAFTTYPFSIGSFSRDISGWCTNG